MTREVIDGVLHETVSVPLASHDDVVNVTVTPAEPAEPMVSSEPTTPDESPKEDGSPLVEEETPVETPVTE
jgi:hypothetical protein